MKGTVDFFRFSFLSRAHVLGLPVSREGEVDAPVSLLLFLIATFVLLLFGIRGVSTVVPSSPGGGSGRGFPVPHVPGHGLRERLGVSGSPGGGEPIKGLLQVYCLDPGKRIKGK